MLNNRSRSLPSVIATDRLVVFIDRRGRHRLLPINYRLSVVDRRPPPAPILAVAIVLVIVITVDYSYRRSTTAFTRFPLVPILFPICYLTRAVAPALVSRCSWTFRRTSELRSLPINRQFHRCFASTGTMFVWALFLIALTASYLSLQSFVDSSSRYLPSSWGGMQWEKQIRASATPRRPGGKSVLLTGAAGFVGTHVSLALRKRGDGVVGLDNFNNYYDPSLKKARKAVLASHGVFVVEGDINDARLLAKLFDAVPFSHVMHLAAQAGVRYAIENPASYVHSNIAGLVTLLEACKSADPQPSIVWASSSSVYGLNEKVPFSELDRTDSPASLYAATKKAGEEITHTYNHIYGLSITGLRFFTVYGPWGRPDMAYFSFTRNILHGKPITVYRGKNGVDLARDFTYIDDIVKGCVASLDTAAKSTGSGGRKKGPAQYRIFNLGNTSPVTVPVLVRILEQNLKAKAKIHEVEMPGNGDVPFTHANISYARAELGYNPTTNLEAGLRKFVKWYLSYYGYNPRTSAKSSKSL